MMMGLRGIPDIPGGVEQHVQNLASELCVLGFDVEVAARQRYVGKRRRDFGGGLSMLPIWSPSSASLETLGHSLACVLVAAVRRPDILHIHAVGPALFTPLARFFGLKVVMTHHGADYDRERWGWGARKLLLAGERAGVMFSNARISVSSLMSTLVADRYRKTCTPIPNGVRIPDVGEAADHLAQWGLTPGGYIVCVSRLVPEKRQTDLLEAFSKAAPQGMKVALVGGAEYGSRYVNELEAAAAADDRIVMTGYITGTPLQQVFRHAAGFVLPSSHEGLPIALLEALSYGLPSLASDIPANLEVGLPSSAYFRLGDVDDLAAKLQALIQTPRNGTERVEYVRKNFSWKTAAEKTAAIYREILPPKCASAEAAGPSPQPAVSSV